MHLKLDPQLGSVWFGNAVQELPTQYGVLVLAVAHGVVSIGVVEPMHVINVLQSAAQNAPDAVGSQVGATAAARDDLGGPGIGSAYIGSRSM